MKKLILSVLFILVSVFGFSQTKTDSTNVHENDLWCVYLVPLKDTSNRKTKEYKEHYLFQVSHNIIYVVNKNQYIKYTMEMTQIVYFADHLEVTAKRFDRNKKEVTFNIPLKDGLVFSNPTGAFTDYVVEVYTEKDIRN